MANSLQQQLMKSGLANKKQANRAKQERRADANRAKRKGEVLETPTDRARRLLGEQAEKDRKLAAQQQAKLHEKEIAAQIKQLITNGRLERDQGDQAYQFVLNSKIKKLYVTAQQHRQLVNGQIALVAAGNEIFELVPTVVAEKIRQRDDSIVLVLNERQSEQDADDDPYADYPIPDDLMW